MQLTPIHDGEILNRSRDLTKRDDVVAELDDLVGGLEQQALSARSGTALAGAPYPEQFFLRCARAVRAAVVQLRGAEAAPPVQPEPKKKP